MSDKDAAKHYQETRDSEEEWGEPVAPEKPSKRLSVIVSVRFSAQEEGCIREGAEARGDSLSSFIRKAALEKCFVRNLVPMTQSASVGAVQPVTTSQSIPNQPVVSPIG